MFSETIRARARGHHISLEPLAELRFAAKTHYHHNGLGVIRSKHHLTGEVEATKWIGLEGTGNVTGLGPSRLGDSRSVTMSLDAEDTAFKALFMEQRQDVVDRPVIFWAQFYDEDLTPLDPKFHIQTILGDRLRMSKVGPRNRGIELILDDFFSRRRRSAHQVVSHADQQARDPGNTGFIYVPDMVDKILNLYDVSENE